MSRSGRVRRLLQCLSDQAGALDEGLLEKAWEDFRRRAIDGNNVPPNVVEQFRGIYYAGATSVLAMLPTEGMPTQTKKVLLSLSLEASTFTMETRKA